MGIFKFLMLIGVDKSFSPGGGSDDATFVGVEIRSQYVLGQLALSFSDVVVHSFPLWLRLNYYTQKIGGIGSIGFHIK